MPTINIEGTDLYYEDSGDGPPMLLGHSFLCSGEMWRAQVPVLAKRYRVINVDLPGHGRSGPMARPIAIADLARHQLAILDHLGIDRAIWMGLSIGGMSALQAIASHPQRFSGLILADTSGETDSLFIKIKYAIMGMMARRRGLRSVLKPVKPIMFGPHSLAHNTPLTDEWGERFVSVDLETALAMLKGLTGRPAVLDTAAKIAVPTLVMVGADDAAQPPARSERLAETIPEAELVKIPSAGHLSALEQPEAFTAAVLDFLNRHNL